MPLLASTRGNPTLESRVSLSSSQLSLLNLGPASQGDLNGISSKVQRLKGLIKGLSNDIEDLSGLGNVFQNKLEEDAGQLCKMLDKLYLANQQLSLQFLKLARGCH